MATIYKAPPTAQGQWVSAYDKRKDFIYEKTGDFEGEMEKSPIHNGLNFEGVDKNVFFTLVNAEQLGKTEPELYELAKENTKELFLSTIRNMNEVVCEMMFGTDELPPEMEEEFRGMMAETLIISSIN